MKTNMKRSLIFLSILCILFVSIGMVSASGDLSNYDSDSVDSVSYSEVDINENLEEFSLNSIVSDSNSDYNSNSYSNSGSNLDSSDSNLIVSSSSNSSTILDSSLLSSNNSNSDSKNIVSSNDNNNILKDDDETGVNMEAKYTGHNDEGYHFDIGLFYWGNDQFIDATIYLTIDNDETNPIIINTHHYEYYDVYEYIYTGELSSGNHKFVFTFMGNDTFSMSSATCNVKVGDSNTVYIITTIESPYTDENLDGNIYIVSNINDEDSTVSDIEGTMDITLYKLIEDDDGTFYYEEVDSNQVDVELGEAYFEFDYELDEGDYLISFDMDLKDYELDTDSSNVYFTVPDEDIENETIDVYPSLSTELDIFAEEDDDTFLYLILTLTDENGDNYYIDGEEVTVNFNGSESTYRVWDNYISIGYIKYGIYNISLYFDGNDEINPFEIENYTFIYYQKIYSQINVPNVLKGSKNVSGTIALNLYSEYDEDHLNEDVYMNIALYEENDEGDILVADKNITVNGLTDFTLEADLNDDSSYYLLFKLNSDKYLFKYSDYETQDIVREDVLLISNQTSIYYDFEYIPFAGDSFTIYAFVSDDYGYSLDLPFTVTVDDKEYIRYIGEDFYININPLEVGVHNLTINFEGYGGYEASNISITFNVHNKVILNGTVNNLVPGQIFNNTFKLYDDEDKLITKNLTVIAELFDSSDEFIDEYILESTDGEINLVIDREFSDSANYYIHFLLDEDEYAIYENAYYYFSVLENNRTYISFNILDFAVGGEIKVYIYVKDFDYGNLIVPVTVSINGKNYTGNSYEYITLDSIDTIGEYNISAVFEGNEYFEASNCTDTLTVLNKYDIKLYAHNALYGENATVYITVKEVYGEGYNGILYVNIDGDESPLNIVNGSYEYIIENITESCVLYFEIYRGETYFGDTEHIYVYVFEDVNLSVDVNDIEYGENANIIVNLSSKSSLIDGIVTLYIGEVEYELDIVNGTGKLSIDNLEPGNYNILVKYDGEKEYINKIASNSFKVSEKEIIPVETILTIGTDDIELGQNLTITVSLSANGTNIDGPITVLVGDNEYEVNTTNGSGSISISNLSLGDYSVFALFKGNENYLLSYAVENIKVSQTLKDTNLLINVNSVGYGENIIINFNLSSGSNLINGSIDVLVDGNNKTVMLNNGIGSLTLSNLSAGDYYVLANYNGTNLYNPSDALAEFKVNRLDTVIIFNNMTTAAVDVATDGRIGKYFDVVLTDANGVPLANKQIKIGFNGIVYERVTNETGGARLQINLRYKGTYTFAIAFLGDDNYTGSFEVAAIKVNLQKPTISSANKSYKASAKTKTLTATFKNDKGNTVSGKKISFTINGKTYTATTNSKGVATVKVSLSTKKTYSCTIKNIADSTYSSTSTKISVKIT